VAGGAMARDAKKGCEQQCRQSGDSGDIVSVHANVVLKISIVFDPFRSTSSFPQLNLLARAERMLASAVVAQQSECA
jgi:hypothetical protein